MECIYIFITVDGDWTGWSDWSDCSKTCSEGTITRTRSCSDPLPQFGGLDCVGNAIDTDTCLISNCPSEYQPLVFLCIILLLLLLLFSSIVDGGWSDWTIWGDCTDECNGGVQTRTRTCDNPVPQFGGRKCGGRSKRTRECNLHPCPG